MQIKVDTSTFKLGKKKEEEKGWNEEGEEKRVGKGFKWGLLGITEGGIREKGTIGCWTMGGGDT